MLIIKNIFQGNLQVKIYWFIILIFVTLLFTNYFEISNDGRHYLSTAESLKEGFKYSSLGRSQSANNLSFLPDWPPVYSVLISMVAFIFKLSVLESVKILHIFLFLVVAVQISKVKIDSYVVLFRITIILILLNTGHFTSSNAEILFYPFIFLIYYKFDWFSSNLFILGSMSGIFYLIKYTFIFLFPSFLLILLLKNIKLNYFLNKNMFYMAARPILFFILGFTVIFLCWHLIILYNTGNFFPGFIGAKHEVNTLQFFRDLIISWNFLPERFEVISFPFGLLLFSVVIVLLCFNIFNTLLDRKRSLNGSIFWEVILLGWLCFFLLEVVLHGISTKRYLDGAEILLLFVLVNFYKIGKYNKGFNYFIILIFGLQLSYLLRNFTIGSFNGISKNIADKNSIQILSNKLANTNTILYTLDNAFAAGIVEFRNWYKIKLIDSTSIPMISLFNDTSNVKILLIQNRDSAFFKDLDDKQFVKIRINR